MSINPLASEKNEYTLLKEQTTSLYKLFNLWCTVSIFEKIVIICIQSPYKFINFEYFSGLLAILQMAYGIGLVLFFFFSFDVNYEKWEIPGSMVRL